MTRALTVVMPVYNEARVIRSVLDDLRTHVLDLVPDSNAVIVDDGSTDDTPTLLSEIANAEPRITVIRQSNAGHGPALRAAYDASDGDWIFHVDSDGQFELADFSLLWDVRDQTDLVLGIRSQRNDPRHRLVLSAACRLVVRVLGGRGIVDANVPFRLVRRELLEHLAPSMPVASFAPSIMISLGAVRSSARVMQISVRHLERPFGQSTLRAGRLARAAWTAFKQLVAFRFARLETLRSTT